jgi:hypothetical protein
MAAGDAYRVGPTSVADTAYLTIQPGSGVEAVVHNIDVPVGTAVEVYRYDGTNSILLDSGSESYSDFHWHVTNTHYLRVKNVSGGAAYLAADGMVTK